MNDSDLKAQFAALRVPERDDEYWNSFPQQVLKQLRRSQAQPAPQPSWVAVFGWNASLALGCVAACFCIWQACSGPVSHAFLKETKGVQQALLKFHSNIGKVMRDEHGLRRLVEDPQ